MSMYHRLLDAQSIADNFEQTRDEVLDAGAYRILEVHCRILSTTGTPDGTLKLQTAAVNEPEAWDDIAGASWSLNGSGGRPQITSFLRYVRAVVVSQSSGSAVALIDIVAKN